MKVFLEKDHEKGLTDLLKASLYSYQYVPSEGKNSYQIISYGFEDLVPECFCKALRGPLFNEKNIKYNTKGYGLYSVDLRYKDQLYKLLNLYEKEEIFSAVVEENLLQETLTVKELKGLKKVKNSFCLDLYLKNLVLYLLFNLDILKEYQEKSPFFLKMNLKEYYGREFEAMKIRYKDSTVFKPQIELPYYLCYSSLEESLTYYLEKNVNLPHVGHEKSTPLDQKEGFFTFLDCFYSYYTFNNISNSGKKGSPLLNPIVEKATHFYENPLDGKSLKDLPPKGYTTTNGILYLWDKSSKANLLALKKGLILYLGIRIGSQKFKKTCKINYLKGGTTLGLIKEGKKGFLVKIRF